MTVVTTIDVYDMPAGEYRAILDRMGVESKSAAGLFLHLTATTEFGATESHRITAGSTGQVFLAERRWASLACPQNT